MPKIHTARQTWKAPAAVVCIPYRLAAECGTLLLLCSWVLTLLSWMRAPPSCAPPHAHSGVGRSPVAIVSLDSGLAWTINGAHFVHLDDRVSDEPQAEPSRQAFHLEWQVPPEQTQPGEPPRAANNFPAPEAERYFCLRWLRDMRLVEVVLPGRAEEHMLRLSNRFACDEPASFFAFRGSSLYSLGAKSFINYREFEHVRAHSDIGPPWRPLEKETSRTRVSIQPLPDRRDFVERSLLELVGRLERNATEAARALARVGAPASGR